MWNKLMLTMCCKICQSKERIKIGETKVGRWKLLVSHGYSATIYTLMHIGNHNTKNMSRDWIDKVKRGLSTKVIKKEGLES